MDVMHSILCTVFLLFAALTVASSHGCAKLPASKAYHGLCYFQYVHGLGFVKRHCPYGTRYSEHDCACVRTRENAGYRPSASVSASASASATSSAASSKSSATAIGSSSTSGYSSLRLSEADRHRIYRILFRQSGPTDEKSDDKGERKSDDRYGDNRKNEYESGDDSSEEDDDSSHDSEDGTKYGSLLSGLGKGSESYNVLDRYLPAGKSEGHGTSRYGEEKEEEGPSKTDAEKYYGFNDNEDDEDDGGYYTGDSGYNVEKSEDKTYHFGDILVNIFDDDDNDVLDDFDDIFEDKFYGLFEFVDDMFDDIFDDDFDDFYDDLFDDDGYDDVFVTKYKHYFDEDSDLDDLYEGFDNFFENFNHVRSLSLNRGYGGRIDLDNQGDKYGGSNDESDEKSDDSNEQEGVWGGKGHYEIFEDGYGKENERKDETGGDSRLFNFARTLKGGSTGGSRDIESILDGFYRDDN